MVLTGFFVSLDASFLNSAVTVTLYLDFLVSPAMSSAEVTLNATALEPIKNLKVTNVTDNYFNIEFTHSLTSQSPKYCMPKHP